MTPVPMKVYIVGPAASGKDTAAQALVRHFPELRLIRIAQPMYDIASNVFGRRRKDRRLLQDIGDALRSVDPDVFIDLVLRSTRDWSWVCPDIRLAREGERLRSNGWIGIRVERPLSARLLALEERGESGADLAHHTEAAVDLVPVDAVVANRGTKAGFEAEVVRTVTRLIRR